MNTDNQDNTGEGLRVELFATLRALREGKIDVERAKAISEVAQTIINSAKVEVDYLRVNNGGESPFFEAAGRKNLPPGITSSRVHRIKG